MVIQNLNAVFQNFILRRLQLWIAEIWNTAYDFELQFPLTTVGNHSDVVLGRTVAKLTTYDAVTSIKRCSDRSPVEQSRLFECTWPNSQVLILLKLPDRSSGRLPHVIDLVFFIKVRGHIFIAFFKTDILVICSHLFFGPPISP
jgi:hypothetical protein